MDASGLLVIGTLLGVPNGFWYGVVGGLAAYAVVHAMPFGVGLQQGRELHITLGRLLGVGIVLVIFLGLGGVASLILSSDTDGFKQQIVYGIGFQSTIGGALQGVKAATS